MTDKVNNKNINDFCDVHTIKPVIFKGVPLKMVNFISIL